MAVDLREFAPRVKVTSDGNRFDPDFYDDDDEEEEGKSFSLSLARSNYWLSSPIHQTLGLRNF